MEDTGVVLDIPLMRPATSAARPDVGRPVAISYPKSKSAKAAKPGRTARLKERAPRAAGEVEGADTRGPLPWVLLLLVLGGAAGGGLYLWQRYGLMADSASQAESDRAAVQAKNAKLDQEVMTKGAELRRAQAALASAGVSPSAEPATPAPERLVAKLDKLVASAHGEVRHAGNRLIVDLGEASLFRADTAELSDHGREHLLELGDALNQFPGWQIAARSHADAKVAASWDLSARRSLAIVRYLGDDALVDAGRLSATAAAAAPAGQLELSLEPVVAQLGR